MCHYTYDQGYVHERCMQNNMANTGTKLKTSWIYYTKEKKEIEPADFVVKDNTRCTLHLFQDSCLIVIV